MSTDISVVSRQLEEVVKTNGITKKPENILAGVLSLSRGIRALKSLLSEEIMNEVMGIQGTDVGFLTDKDKSGGYSVDAVKDVLIVALLKGAIPFNNEFNIIAGKCYLTKNYYARMLLEYPGFSDLRIRFEVPEPMRGYAAVGASATWIYNSNPNHIEFTKGEKDFRIIVKNDDKYGSPDQSKGKAERKLLKSIWEIVTGQLSMDGDVEPVTPDAATVATEATEVSHASIELTESLIRRVSACETREDLEEINNEMTHGKDEGFIDKDQYAHVRNALNSRYRELFPVNQSQE